MGAPMRWRHAYNPPPMEAFDPDRSAQRRPERKRMVRSPRADAYLQIAILTILYFAAAKCSLLLAVPPGYATAVWPPSGIALAAILLLGHRLWPGIWIGAALVNFSVNS